MRRRILLACALAICAGSLILAHEPSAQGKLTTVILVRHGERGPDEGPASPITEKGQERARELARVLHESRVTQIFVSEFLRTQQTAEPLAKALGIEPEIVAQGKGVDDLAGRIRASAGHTILISSHRSRVEPLIEKLGGGKVAPLADAEYDNLFVLTIPETGAPKLVVLKYGAR